MNRVIMYKPEDLGYAFKREYKSYCHLNESEIEDLISALPRCVNNGIECKDV